MPAKGVPAAILALAALALLGGAATTAFSADDDATEASASAYAVRIAGARAAPWSSLRQAAAGSAEAAGFDSGDGAVAARSRGDARDGDGAVARRRDRRGERRAGIPVRRRDHDRPGGGESDGRRGARPGRRERGLVPGRGPGRAGVADRAGPGSRVPLGDWGYAVVLEQTVQTDSGDGAGFRGAIAALHVYLTADHGGLPAGSEIAVGYAEASALAVAPAPAAASPKRGNRAEAELSTVRRRRRRARPGGDALAAPAARGAQPAAGAGGAADERWLRLPRPRRLGGVLRRLRRSPGRGRLAPRNDVFAPEGTPVLAVADGELFSVGWNELGGWRLWLRDGSASEFYYAHLSAYSPLAFEGSRVERAT